MFYINEVKLFGDTRFFITSDEDDHKTYVSTDVQNGTRVLTKNNLNAFNLPPSNKLIPTREEAIAFVQLLDIATKPERKTVEQIKTEALLHNPLDEEHINKTTLMLLKETREKIDRRDPRLDQKLFDPLLNPDARTLLNAGTAPSGFFTKK